MSLPYSLRQQGYLYADNAGSPGITEDQARALGLPMDFARRAIAEADLLSCRHCGGVVIKNPDRQRPRAHCWACNWYMCDGCAIEASLPDYTHLPFMMKAELVKRANANLICI
jgi:hypothetical protein